VSARHRRHDAGRHRAPHSLLATDRGRTVALGATLGGALLTGVAGGSAAAAAEHHAPAATTPSAPDRLATASAPWAAPAAPVSARLTGASAAAVHRKAHRKVTAT
jgi:hypothetical protein